jgi:hypothetical protein
MPKSYYLPPDDPGKVTWLNNFASKLPTHQTTLGLTAAEVGSVQADNDFFLS